MSLKRRRYPSDERPYFRVLDAILDDPVLNSAPLDQQMVFIKALAMLNRTRSRDGELTLDARGLKALTRRGKVDDAEKMIRRVAASFESAASQLGVDSPLTWTLLSADSESTPRRVGVYYLIRIPKWPQIQGFAPPLRGEERREEESREEEPPEGGEGVEGTPQSKKPKPEPSKDAIRLADLWADLRQAERGTKRPTDMTTWRHGIRKLLDNDGKPAAEVERVIRWLYGENLKREYQFQCHSPANIRRDDCEKYDRIVALLKSNGAGEVREDSRVTTARARYERKQTPTQSFSLDNPPKHKDDF